MGRRRKRRSKRKDVVRNMDVSPFPSSFITKHRYCTNVVLDPATAGIADNHVFSANSLYDPDNTGGGHQPLGFDNLTPIYEHYTVLGARITIRPVAAAGDTGSGACMIGCYIDSDAAALTTLNTVREQGGNVERMLTPINAAGTCTVTKNFSSKKFFGVTDVRDNSNLQGRDGGNPGEQAFFIVYCDPVVDGSNLGAIYCSITIEYIAQWSERKPLVQS